jgi:cell division protein FtsW
MAKTITIVERATNVKSFWDVFIGDKAIWMLYFILSVVSLIAVFSSSSMVIMHNGVSNTGGVFIKQFVLLLVGILIALTTSWLIARWSPDILRKFGWPIYWISVILLLMTFSSAFSQEINGERRWINILGFSVQPSEVAKMTLVIVLSKIFSKNRNQLDDTKKVLLPVMLSTFVVAGIVFKSNFSSSLFLILIMFFMMYVGRLPWKQILLIIGTGLILAFSVGTVIIKHPDVFPRGTTWQKRLVSFYPPLAEYATGYDAETKIDNYQVTQAEIAIAEGGIIGKMPGNSTQRYKLSQAYCDFIFAIIIEETGWWGMIGVIILYLIFIIRIYALIRRSVQAYEALLLAGLGFIIVAQALLHMGVVTGMLPATGQTLPVISAGGSSLFITSIEFGIILGTIQYNKDNSDKITDNKTEKNDESSN